MKRSETYVDLDGNEHSLALLDAEERRLVARLQEHARNNPDWTEFDNVGYKAVGAFYDARGLSRKKSIRTIPYRICQDLSARLGIAQGMIRPDDPRSDLEQLIENHFPSPEAFAKAAGISIDVLKEFLVSTEATHKARPARKRRRKPTGPRPVTFELHHVGGPADGQMSYAFRPYFRMKHPDNAVYQAKMDGDQPVMEWVDDETRAITLYFEGYWPDVAYPE